MQLKRLPGRKNCERVKAKGYIWKGKHLSVRWMPGAPRGHALPIVSTVFVGTLASTKLDKSAVKRNRMRRRCREALRMAIRAGHFVQSNTALYQLIIVPRSSSLNCNFAELLEDVRSFLSSLNR